MRIDTKGIVIQRSKHNYAGPNCPGAGWTCTTAKHVVQIAYKGNDSKFDCTPSTVGPQPGPDTCSIVQISAGGTNQARCVERTNAPSVVQTCLINQQNVDGDNWAEIRQAVDANDGPTQTSTQYASLTQKTTAGSNSVVLDQDVKQSTKDTDSGGAQTQDAHQNVSVDQESDTGDNTAHVQQSQAQKAKAEKTTTMQGQNATDDGQNAYAGIEQHSTSGHNVAHLNQSIDQDADAKKTTTMQQQGSPSGGVHGHFDQLSTGLSRIDGNQRENQNLKAEGKHNSGGSQYQYGPAYYGSQQGSNPDDRYDLDQSSTQKASDPTLQDNKQYANCDTTGTCTADQRIRQQNGPAQTNSCSGEACHIGQTATATSEGTSVDTCTGLPQNEGENPCPSPPPPPPPPPTPCPFEFCGDVVGQIN